MWHPPFGSVALCADSLEKGQWLLPTFPSGNKIFPSSCFDARHFSSSLYTTGAFSGYPSCYWSSEGVNLSEFMHGFFKGNCLVVQKFLPLTQSPLVFHLEIMRTYFLGTGLLGWGPWCGAGTPCSQDIPPKFLSTIQGCGTSPFCISTPPTSLDGCGCFNSVVIRLPFNLISDGAE